ncbi:MAG: N-acetylmuramoyl-L-alanine amidase, partial [Bacteroidetes bacterium QS_8_68_15]
MLSLLLIGAAVLVAAPSAVPVVPATAPAAERAAAPAAERAPSVERISFAARSDGDGYVVRVHTTGAVGVYGAPQVTDGAIVWKLYNTRAAETLRASSAPGPVTRYRAEQSDDGHLRLRFALAEGAQVDVKAYRDRASDDLLMNVTYAGGGPPVARTSPGEGGGEERAPGITVPEEKKQTRAAPEVGSAQGTTAGERWKFDTVVIDAGHGGKDPGAQAYGLNEKDVVLGIAQKLGGYIEEKMGDVDVVYTREEDRFITLRDRGRIANEAGAKLFISLHANAARNRSAHGTETYFLGTHKTETARKVMERENSVIQLEDNPDQYEQLTNGVMETLTQSAYMRQSEFLADLVQDQFEHR